MTQTSANIAVGSYLCGPQTERLKPQKCIVCLHMAVPPQCLAVSDSPLIRRAIRADSDMLRSIDLL